MLHLYCGNGKGKTTAAMGLALRAAGRGKRVVIAQFLKVADSGERLALARLPQDPTLPGWIAPWDAPHTGHHLLLPWPSPSCSPVSLLPQDTGRSHPHL